MLSLKISSNWVLTIGIGYKIELRINGLMTIYHSANLVSAISVKLRQTHQLDERARLRYQPYVQGSIDNIIEIASKLLRDFQK